MAAPTDRFDDNAWCHALTLAERVDLVRASEGSAAGRSGAGAGHIARWTSRRPFDQEGVFPAWLDSHGWTERDLEAALAATPDDVLRRLDERPAWWRDLASAYGEPATPDSFTFPPEDPRNPQIQLLRVFRPLVALGAGRMRRAVAALRDAHGDAPFEPDRAVDLQLAHLTSQLFEMSLRVLILELNVARIQGHLEGETGAERFRSFVERLDDPKEAVELLAEYPVLARLAAEAVDRWSRVGVELLRHLAEDVGLLEERFSPGRRLGTLEHVEGGAGDTHRRGRSVHILTFDSGLRLVYKPRPLAVDRHFRDLLDWLNEHGDHPPLRAPETLDRGTHGWVELVEADPCTSEAEVERFYERQGAFLAVLYAVDASDFHFENLIAAGEHPVLVDLESLFAQRAGLFDPDRALGRASETVTYSVLRTGLLPRMAWADGDFAGLDYSGLGGEAGQRNPPVAVPEALGTDEMRMVRKETPFEGGRNRPTLNGEAVRLADFTPAVLRGFESVHRTLARHREELLAPGGVLEAFAEDPVRIILRPTQTYRLLLLDGYHPDLLRDALDRDRHLDRLWLGVRNQPEVRLVAAAEREELDQLDIPVFHSYPGERDLVSGGGRLFRGYFDRSGLEIAAERLRGFDEADLELQTWMIGSSLASMESVLMQAPGGPSIPLEDREPVPADRLLAAATAIRRRLEERALVGAGGDVSWVGIGATDERSFSPRALGPDLYSGIPGVALFLGYLGDAGGDGEARSLAEAAWRTIRAGLDDELEDIREIGAFTGLGGLIYTAVHLGLLWQRPDVLAVGEHLASVLDDLLEEDRALDVIGGAAGCIPVLLLLHRATGSAPALETALRCGEHLLRTAKPYSGGIGWTPPRTGDRPLSGLSHGAAGFGWALLTLGHATSEGRFVRAAREALAYERTLFDPEQENWRDLRPFLGPEGGFNAAWCHGAVGIALARMASLDLEPAEGERREMRREIEIALRTTRRYGFGFDHSLCHGAAGTIEALREAGRRLGRDEDALHAGRVGAVICEEVEAGRFRCGVPGGFETPGLMDGLAGIGYGLLRLADPARVPSVLLLEAPPGLGTELTEPTSPGALRAS